MSLLERNGRFSAAEALADSIVASGGVRSAPVHLSLDRSRPYVAAIYLRSKQWGKLATLVPVIGAQSDQPQCNAITALLTSQLLPFPVAELRAIADSVRVHRDDVLTFPALAPCADSLAKLGR